MGIDMIFSTHHAAGSLASQSDLSHSAEGWLKPCFQYYKFDHGHRRVGLITKLIRA